MVSPQFTQGLNWLHARVGRRKPVMRISETSRRSTNSRARMDASSPAALRLTVYLPALTDKKRIA